MAHRDLSEDLRYIADIQEDANAPTLRAAAKKLTSLKGEVKRLRAVHNLHDALIEALEAIAAYNLHDALIEALEDAKAEEKT